MYPNTFYRVSIKALIAKRMAAIACEMPDNQNEGIVGKNWDDIWEDGTRLEDDYSEESWP